MASEKGIKFICDLCGQLIEIGRPRYVCKGEITCAYDGGVFDETPSLKQGTVEDELRRLIYLAEQKSEKELMDEVYYAFNLDLCSSCRIKLYQILDKQPRD